MAITLADFNKIWSSTSPLSPYTFSDDNYNEGWNFVGQIPPSRQMWDFLQKNNDEKMQYLANNYLPLSGGTMTGQIKTSYNDSLVKTTDTDYLTIMGGSTFSTGASLLLNGGSRSTNAGKFQLRARTDANTLKELVGGADGTLTWNGQNVATEDKFPRRYNHYTAFNAGGSLTIPNGQYLIFVYSIGNGIPTEAHYVALLGSGANIGVVDIKKGSNYSSLGFTYEKSGDSNIVLSVITQFTHIVALRLYHQ